MKTPTLLAAFPPGTPCSCGGRYSCLAVPGVVHTQFTCYVPVEPPPSQTSQERKP